MWSLGALLLLVTTCLTTGKKVDHRSVWAVSGRHAELPCVPAPKKKHDQPVLVLWYRSGDTLQPIYSYDARSGKFNEGKSWAKPELFGSRATFTTHSDTPALLLKPVLGTDQGHYTCRIEYRFSPSTLTVVNLTVAVPPEPPMIIWKGVGVNGELGPLMEGTNVDLLCRSEGGRPPPLLTWWWRGARLPSHHGSSLNPTNGVVESKLEMKASRDLHGATLTCHAQTPAPDTSTAAASLPQPLSSSVTLNVSLPPLSLKILGTEEAIPAGATVEFVCRSYGSQPPADITWRQGHTRLSEVIVTTDAEGNVTTSTLTLPVHRDHHGVTLSCTASNPLLPQASITTTRRLNVLYKPMVELHLGRLLDGSQIREGNDVFFECTVKANPTVFRLYWYHNGIEVMHNLSAGVVLSGEILVLRNLQREQSGHYTCAAANQEGHNTSNALHLTVQHAPVCAQGDLKRTLGVARRTHIIVTCRVEAEPAHELSWSWVRILDGEELPIHEIDVKSSGLTSSVEIMPVTLKDYGDVVCKARNKIGRQQEPCVVSLVPAGPPDPPLNCSAALTTPSETEASAYSLIVGCFEGFDGGLPQEFVLEAWQNDIVVTNITSDFPEWTVNGLESGLDTSLFIIAINARGRSEKLHLEVPMARAQQRAAPESRALGVPTLLGAAVGVVAVLVLSLIVSVIIARRSRNSCQSKNNTHPDRGSGETPEGSEWECHQSKHRVNYHHHHQHHHHHHPEEDTTHSLPYTSLLHTSLDSARSYPNGTVMNGSPGYSGKLDVPCQASDSCSVSSCDSKGASLLKPSSANRQCLSGEGGQTGINTESLSPCPSPLSCTIRVPRSGHSCYSTPCQITSKLVRGNGSTRAPLDQYHKNILEPSNSSERTLMLQQYPERLGDAQGREGNTAQTYELFHPTRKPPKAYSRTSLPNTPHTQGSVSSLSSSVSHPQRHIISGNPENWQCPRAPLAEDEVKDAYAHSQPVGG